MIKYVITLSESSGSGMNIQILRCDQCFIRGYHLADCGWRPRYL
jgi:hypothetical protein